MNGFSDIPRHDFSEDKFRLLFEAGRQLSSTLEIQEVFERLRSIVSRAMPCDGIIVSSFDPSTQLITCEYAYSGGQVIDASALPPLKLSPQGGVGMQSEVIRTAKPMMFGDVAERVSDKRGTFMHVASDGTVRDLKESSPPPTQCALMTPVMLEGEVRGVVQVMTDQASAYTGSDLELLQGIVFLLGAAVQNAKIYQQKQHELAERLKAEQALRESEARYRFLSEAGPGFTWSTDADFNPVVMSQKWLEFVGKSREEIERDGWTSLIHPDDLPALKAEFQNARDRKQEFNCRHRILGADGSYHWVQSRARPLLDENSALQGWCGLSLDIADQRRAEQELESKVRDRTRQLEAANHEMEGFTYSVSHDLRGPLRAIMATSLILKEDYGDLLPADAKDQLERQARAASKMGQLIDDLLRLSRIGRQEMGRQRVNLSRMVQELVAELRAPVELRVDPDLEADADPKLVRLALQNLVENSVKFSGKRETPVVEFGRAPDGSFFIRDNGIGFDMQYSHRMYLPFERLVSDAEYPGTGIGLANVKRIVERHGGSIWAESREGDGATFYFTLS